MPLVAFYSGIANKIDDLVHLCYVELLFVLMISVFCRIIYAERAKQRWRPCRCAACCQ